MICWIESVDPVDDLRLTNQIYSVLLNTFEFKEITEVQNAHLKDVRAQNVPTYRFFFNFPRRKVMIYFCQKGKKNGGHRARFRDHEVHF